MADANSPSSASDKYLVQILGLDSVPLVELQFDKPVTINADGWGEMQVMFGKELFVMRIPEQGCKILIEKTKFIGD